MSTLDVPEIDVEELRRRREQGAVLIDVRNPDEYEAGHVPGAQLIPLHEVPGRMDEIPSTGPVLVICKSGGRSLRAAEYLRASDVDAVNVAGGTMAWIDAGHPVDTGGAP